MIHTVLLSTRAVRQLRKVPAQVVVKLYEWVASVEMEGLEEVRKIPGFHDEPLRGERSGQRSIRLNRQYRAIYVVLDEGALEVARVEEVTKHAY